jgi:hypothetical protein
MWLMPQILEWEPTVESWTLYEDESWRRAYTHWSHAEHLLEKSNSSLDLIDVITTLKRAVDHRLRLIDETYDIRSIPIKDKPSVHLELLSFFGIVRPVMVQKLLDIRNAVEHQDAEPPAKDTCETFLEFSWYFLRSTDMLVRRVALDLVFEPIDIELAEDYWAHFVIGPRGSWVPAIRGWFTPDMLSSNPVDGWINIKLDKIETKEQLLASEGKSKRTRHRDSGRGKNLEDIYIVGEMRGPAQELLRLYRIYFEAI